MGISIDEPLLQRMRSVAAYSVKFGVRPQCAGRRAVAASAASPESARSDRALLMQGLLQHVQRAFSRCLLAAARWQSGLAAHRRARRTMHALGQLDDRSLRDLGLSRSELLSAALDIERMAGDATMRRPRGIHA